MIANVRDHGARGDGKTDDTAAILTAAKAASPGVLFLPPGKYMTTGLSFAGLSCGITGSGDATAIAAIAPQSGPVLDFTGYLSPPGFYDLRIVERFRILGDGRFSPSSKGIVLGSDDEAVRPLTGMIFRDLSIRATGGTCFDLAHSICCHFERITLNCPVQAGANDTPWICARGPFNGNTLTAIGFRSDGPVPLPADVGRSGAARFLESQSSHFAPEQNVFRDWWFEYQHLGEGSCLFALQGNNNVIDGFRYFDTIRMPGATGTAAIRLLNPSPGKANYGGNTVRCQLTGVDTPVHSPGIGCEVFQPANSVEGPKFAGGSNVVLHPTARYTAVAFRGGHPDPAGRAGVVGPDGQATTVGGTAAIDDLMAAGSRPPQPVVPTSWLPAIQVQDGSVRLNVADGSGVAGTWFGNGRGEVTGLITGEGAWMFVHIADAVPPSQSIFFGSEHWGRPCYKDVDGEVSEFVLRPGRSLKPRDK